MAQYRILIVDDEAHPRDLLHELIINHFPELEVRSVCRSGREGLQAIHDHLPHLVFLDVEMPGMTGFQMLEELGEINFKVIFTTSYSKYALDAFRVSALDFLMKPIEYEALIRSVNRFKEHHQETSGLANIQNLLRNLRMNDHEEMKLALPTSNGYLFVRIRDIIRCESQNVYTTFFLSDKNQVVVSRTMKECEEMLSEFNFHRVHQSHLINMRYIRKYIKGDGGEVEMEDGSRLEVSRRKKEDFLAALRRV